MTRLTLLLICALAWTVSLSAGGRTDFAHGVRLLRDGDAAGALAALRAAEEGYGDEAPASLLQNLALAAWKAGQHGAAESYAERAAARDAALTPLRESLVGAARLREGREALKAGDLAKAEERAGRAVQAFEQALRMGPGRDALRRNLLRALELQREIEEQKKQRQQQQDSDQTDKSKEPQEGQDSQEQDKEEEEREGQDSQQGDKGERGEQGEQGEQGEGDKQQGDPKPRKDEGESSNEPNRPQPGKGEDNPQPEPSKQEEQEEQKGQDQQQGAAQQDAQPAAGDAGDEQQGQAQAVQSGELSPEERQRILQRLQQMIQDARARRSTDGSRHKPGKKDW
jgi:hypothetical protein